VQNIRVSHVVVIYKIFACLLSPVKFTLCHVTQFIDFSELRMRVDQAVTSSDVVKVKVDWFLSLFERRNLGLSCHHYKASYRDEVMSCT